MCSYTAGNNFMWVWTNLCNRMCSYAAGKNFMRVWTHLCDRKCSYAAENYFTWVWKNLCHRKCFYIAGNNFMRVWTNLCHRKYFGEITLLAGAPFWIFLPLFEQECEEPFYIPKPKPIWKKASPRLQRPCHTDSTSGLTSSTPRFRTHTLDPTPDAPGPKTSSPHPIIN